MANDLILSAQAAARNYNNSAALSFAVFLVSFPSRAPAKAEEKERKESEERSEDGDRSGGSCMHVQFKFSHRLQEEAVPSPWIENGLWYWYE